MAKIGDEAYRASSDRTFLASIKERTKAMELYARQGDLLIFRGEDNPRRLKEVTVNDGTILKGEVTGHAHRLVGTTLFNDPSLVDGLFATVENGTEVVVVHEEHDPVPLPPGSYSFRRQRVIDLLAAQQRETVPFD